jgi:asparagine synthase (glutamine-hydrolysing)
LKARDLLTQYDLASQYFLAQELQELGLGNSRYPSILSQLPFGINQLLDDLSLMMLIDLRTYLPDDLLVKLDRATMGTALEGRDPFLDHKILEWTSQLPSEFKYRGGKSKYLLRKVVCKYIPQRYLERPKQGFGVPIYGWFRRDLKELYMEYLNEKRLGNESLFNPQKVKSLLQNYLSGLGTDYYKLWLLFIFEIWREKWKV